MRRYRRCGTPLRRRAGPRLAKATPTWATACPLAPRAALPTPLACCVPSWHRGRRGTDTCYSLHHAGETFPCRPHVAPCGNHSLGWGLWRPLEARQGGPRPAFPHSEAGHWPSGLPLAAGGPPADGLSGDPRPIAARQLPPLQQAVVSTVPGHPGPKPQVPLSLRSMPCASLPLASFTKCWAWTHCPLRCPRSQRTRTQWTTRVSALVRD